jgi:hypothetical protein
MSDPYVEWPSQPVRPPMRRLDGLEVFILAVCIGIGALIAYAIDVEVELRRVRDACEKRGGRAVRIEAEILCVNPSAFR